MKCNHRRKGIFQGKVFCKDCKLILNENLFKLLQKISGNKYKIEVSKK